MGTFAVASSPVAIARATSNVIAPTSLAFASASDMTPPVLTVTPTATASAPVGISTDSCIVPSLTVPVAASGATPSNVIHDDAQTDANGPNALVNWQPGATVAPAASVPAAFIFSPVGPGVCTMRAGGPGNQDEFAVAVGF